MRLKLRLNQPKKPRFSWWSAGTGFKMVAHSAGVSDKAMKAENSMLDTMDSENWR